MRGFIRASAQDGQAAEEGGEKEAACGCGGVPLIMLIHGDCSGVATALKTMCVMLRMGCEWHERTRQVLAACADQMTRAGPGTGDASFSAVIMEIECKAREHPVLSELSQKFDGVLKRCGAGKRVV